ncbi:MAG: cellulase family glycosylhydrolase [Planctomycetes bacterium]|nr:cellulase family glycosylhydrolase [Planctomycetota bacterium]
MRLIGWILPLACLTCQLFSAEDYGPADASPWLDNALVWDKSPVDLSFLNEKPAGKHGFVVPGGEHFRFEDGTPVKFWGCTVAASALFAEKDQLTAMAKRIAAMGFNLVRIHHHDSMSWVKPNIIDDTKDNTRDLNMAALDKIDWFIHCLKEEGVYIYYDLHNGRQFKSGDGIKLFDEMTKRSKNGASYCYIDEDIQKLMQEHSEKTLTHVNPYTKLSYAKDPAIAIYLLTNENDVANNGGNRFLADKGVPQYNKIFNALATAYAKENSLDAGAVLKTWEPGDSKVFLAHQEGVFFEKMIKHLRGLGVKTPVIGTNWAYGGLFCVVGMTKSTDGTDQHGYEGGGSYLVMDPQKDSSLMMTVAKARVAGKPFLISEWNIVFEGRGGKSPVHRASYTIGMAAMGAHQGWDAPIIYNYRQTGGGQPSRQNEYETMIDTALMGAMPAGAILFRRDVTESPTTTVLLADRKQIYFEKATPMVAMRTSIEQTKTGFALEKELPGLKNPKTEPLDKNFLEGKTSVTSDTGEIMRDWGKGVQTIDTPRSQVAQGFYGGSTLKTKDVTFAPKTAFSVLAVNSLTNAPIASASSLLITALSQADRQNTQCKSQLVTGGITIKFAKKPAKAKITPLMGNGTKGDPQDLAAGDDGSVTVDLGAFKTHWLLLETDLPAVSASPDKPKIIEVKPEPAKPDVKPQPPPATKPAANGSDPKAVTPTPAADDPETVAKRKLSAAKIYITTDPAKAKELLRKVITDFPDTQAAKDARQELNKLN